MNKSKRLNALEKLLPQIPIFITGTKYKDGLVKVAGCDNSYYGKFVSLAEFHEIPASNHVLFDFLL